MDQTSTPQTLFDKLWQSHLVDQTDDGECLIYVDRHLVYEVTSPQAFEGLRLIARHQKVYATLGQKMHTDEVHALSMNTYTPAEWAAQQG